MKISNSTFLFYFKKVFTWRSILLVIGWINFMIFFWGIFLSQKDGFIIEFVLVMVSTIFIVETYLYRISSNKSMMRFQQLMNENKRAIKVNLFLLVFLFSMMVLLFFFGIEWIYQYFGVLPLSSLVGTSSSYIYWDNSIKWWLFLFYQLLLMILLIICYVYFLNHFIKNQSIVYGIAILSMLFSLIIIVMNPLYVAIPEDDFTGIERQWYLKSEPKDILNILSFSLIPWMQSKPFIQRLILTSSWFQNIKYFDYSQLGSYSNLIWTPYFTMGILLIIPSLFLRKKF